MEPISSVPKQSAETTIHTAGGAYISGNVVAETFIGRDQYNYYFIGLAPLVHDPTRRFRNFLNEYLGIPGQHVPFGGRQAQLAELHSWLNAADAPPYYLMTAEAGRGKSALLCRWMEEVRQQRPEVEVIFIPISIRFETAAQDTVFAALAARLAKFYDEPLKPAALSGAQWQGVCESYLDRTPPAGKQLLIILDGLDEATGWQFGAGFFSTNPPPGLRIVVTARLRVGESTPQGWAATLGWQGRLTRTATLPPLSRMGVEEALASMGDPLAGFADQVTIVEQLYRLTEGDPLLVRLYVQEFEKQKAALGTLTSAALQQMTPGLHGYFDQWWKGQKVQWRAQGGDPEKEETHLSLLLDALSAAFGPLTLDDLANLHPELESSRLIRAQLQSIERWVIGDGKAQGYSYSHPRLGYYFWEQLSNHEQRKWDERFCAWGATTLTALNADQFDPKAAPVYLLRHYANHLQRSHAPAEAFYALVSNGWRKAWEELDVSYSGFLNDVTHVETVTQKVFNPTQLGKSEVLVQQLKAALCRSSVVALGSKVSPELLRSAIIHDLRTPAQVLAIITLMPDENQRVESLIVLIPYLPLAVMDQVLALIKEFGDEDDRNKVLRVLAPYLHPSLLAEALSMESLIVQRPFHNRYHVRQVSVLPALVPYLPAPLLIEALAIARMMRDESASADALDTLAPHLPPYLLKDALEMARSFRNKFLCAKTLGVLGSYLPETQRLKVMEEALSVVRRLEFDFECARALAVLSPYLPQPLLMQALKISSTITDPGNHVEALCELIPYLPRTQRLNALEEVMSTARMIKYNSVSTSALVKLLAHLSNTQRAEVLAELLATMTFTDSITDSDYDDFDTLVAVAPYLSECLMREVLGMVKTLNNESTKAKVMNAIVPYLSKRLMREVLKMVKMLKYESTKAEVLSALSSHLPQSLIREALAVAKTIENTSDLASALIALIPFLPESLLVGILSEALMVARKIEDESSLAKALCALVPYLSKSQSSEVLMEALSANTVISDESEVGKVLEVLAPHLLQHQLMRVLTTAEAIGDEYIRANNLCVLAPHLPQSLLVQALAIARTIGDEYLFASSMVVLAVQLPENQKSEVLMEALAAARMIDDEDLRFSVLTALAVQLSENQKSEVLMEALAVARMIDDRCNCALAMATLAVHLPENQKSEVLMEALAVARMIDYERYHAEVLVMLVPYLPSPMIADALAAARSIKDRFDYTEVLQALAPHLPDSLMPEAFATAKALMYESVFANALCALIPYLPHSLLLESFEVAKVTTDESALASILCVLAPYLTQPLLFEALAVARMIRSDIEHVSTLSALAPHLWEPLKNEVLREALTATQATEFDSTRAFHFSELIPHLPSSMLDDVFTTINVMTNKSAIAASLGTLIPYLPEAQKALSVELVNTQIFDNEHDCTDVLVTLAPYLPRTLQTEALASAITIEHDSSRRKILSALVSPLCQWGTDLPKVAYLAYSSTLQQLSQRPRPKFLEDIIILMPFILALTGDEAPQAAEGIYQAIQEVCEWWP